MMHALSHFGKRACATVLTATLVSVAWAQFPYDTPDPRLPSPRYRNLNPIHFPPGPGAIPIEIVALELRSVMPRIPPPDPGMQIDSFFDVFYEINFTANGLPAVQSGNGQLGMRILGGPSGTTRLFETEMLQMDLIGGPLMIRESPTLPSQGRTSLEELGGGMYRVDSFFDVFTELSLDGGASWIPSEGNPCRIVGTVPEPASLATLGIAAVGLLTRRRRR